MQKTWFVMEIYANAVAKLEFESHEWDVATVSGKGTKVNQPAIEGTHFALALAL